MRINVYQCNRRGYRYIIYLYITIALLSIDIGYAQTPYYTLTPSVIKQERLFDVEIVDDPVMGDCFQFNGKTSYIEIVGEDIDTCFTASMWIKPHNLTLKNETFFGKQNYLWLRTTTLRNFQITQPSLADNNTDSLILGSHQWIHVTVRKREESITLFYNGKKIDSFRWNNSKKELPQTPLFVGKDMWKQNFHGRVDSIKIWNEPLTDKRVADNYARERGEQNLQYNLVYGHLFDNSSSFYSTIKELDPIETDIEYIDDSGKVAAKFNGKSSCITVGDLDIDRETTISVWVKSNSQSEYQGAIVNGGFTFSLRSRSESLLFTIPQIVDFQTKEKSLPLGVWKHVVATYIEGEEAALYIDGEQILISPVERAQKGDKSIEVGTNIWDNWFDGDLDNLVIWRRVLSGSEIETLYNYSDEEYSKLLNHPVINMRIKRTSKIALVVGLILTIITLSIYLKRRYDRERVLLQESIRKRIENEPQQDRSQQVDIINIDTEKRQNKREEIEQIRSIIRVNISDSTFDVNSFAKLSGISRTALYNRLNNYEMGSPKSLIRAMRAEQACHLLSDITLSITDIMYETGYDNRSAFNRCFKQEIGVTPTQYRDQLKTVLSDRDK